jgi:hypothetical protein
MGGLRQPHQTRSSPVTVGDILAVRHARRDCLFDRAGRVLDRVVLALAERGHLGQCRAGDRERAVVVGFELDPIAEHYFSPKSLRILFTRMSDDEPCCRHHPRRRMIQ